MQSSKKYLFLFALALGALLFAVKPAHAEIIDRIQINQVGDEAEIQIRFVSRIQFLRQVALKNGDVRIYFNLLEIDPTDTRLIFQKRNSPPSNIVPSFTVAYPELDSSLSISFGKVVDYRVRPGNDGRSISVFTPIIKPASALQAGAASLAQPVLPRSAAEIASAELEAKQLMDKANLAQKNNLTPAVIEILQQLLGLPANQQSQAAQYMLGQAYEKNGEFAKARTEYDLYLKRYPKADNLPQVKDSLARVFMAAYLAEKSVPEQQAISDKMTFFGSVSQNYYHNIMHTDNSMPPSTSIISSVDTEQSQLFSSLELTGLKHTESNETRLVLRDTFTANFLPDIGNSNFLNAAYVERNTNDQSRFYGLGRQIGGTGGVPSRFDGAWLISNLNSAWHVKGSLGSPVVSPGIIAETKTFAAFSVDLTRQPGQWSGNAYWVGQRVVDIMDRRAAGIEAHYFDALSNHMGLFEYDTLFKKLNIGLIQGNWTTLAGANYNMRLDHRKHLQLTNALLREQPNQSIDGLRQSGVTVDTLLDYAWSASPISNQFVIGMTQPYSTHLKLGGDIRISNTTSYEAYDPLQNAMIVFPRVWAYTYTAQVAGNNLLFNNDLDTASVSYTNASIYKAESLTFSHAATFLQNWQLNIFLQLYAENNSMSGDMMQINPSIKLSYRMSSSLNFELAAGLTHTDSSAPALDSKTHGKYFNFGYRKNF
ncbi:MAG: hypothetical protein HY016_11910 [Nitrosomonadales bacterium]|nr:hypothetical protein [Nitrosomonadales bacterium]